MARILIVDDKPEIRTLLDATLERGGHTVLQAANAQEAWQILAEQTLDLLFTDIGLPDEDGIELAKRVRASFGALPVVFVTAHHDAAGLVKGQIDPPFSILEKPFHFDDVARLVNDLLTRED